MKDLLIGLGLLSCPAGVFVVFGLSGFDALYGEAEKPVSELSIQEGGLAFAGACAECHGRTARGSERGPDLIQQVYGPSLRSDDQFRHAIRAGRKAQRASYLDMPAFSNLPDPEVELMIGFLREVQKSNGIR